MLLPLHVTKATLAVYEIRGARATEWGGYGRERCVIRETQSILYPGNNLHEKVQVNTKSKYLSRSEYIFVSAFQHIIITWEGI